MVVREGAELALIFRAVEFSAAGVDVWIGTILGLAIAVAVGVFFFQGTLRVPIGRFFAVTSIILMIVAFQLALTGIHELSEAQWIASSQREMAIVGPVVRNDVFFFMVILGAVAILVLREWLKLSHAARAKNAAPQEADGRGYAGARNGTGVSQRRWTFAAAIMSVLVIVALTDRFCLHARVGGASGRANSISRRMARCAFPISQVNDGEPALLSSARWRHPPCASS